MSLEYKRLTEKELDIFIEMRINQLREEGAKENIDLRPALQDYYKRHMADGRLSEQVECLLSKNHRTLLAQVEKWDFYPACIPTLIIDEWELQKSY